MITMQGGALLALLLWIVHAWFDVARHHDKARVVPVRIRASAMGDDIPDRDCA